jgi:hypothetical protein
MFDLIPGIAGELAELSPPAEEEDGVTKQPSVPPPQIGDVMGDLVMSAAEGADATAGEPPPLGQSEVSDALSSISGEMSGGADAAPEAKEEEVDTPPAHSAVMSDATGAISGGTEEVEEPTASGDVMGEFASMVSRGVGSDDSEPPPPTGSADVASSEPEGRASSAASDLLQTAECLIDIPPPKHESTLPDDLPSGDLSAQAATDAPAAVPENPNVGRNPRAFPGFVGMIGMLAIRNEREGRQRPAREVGPRTDGEDDGTSQSLTGSLEDEGVTDAPA